MITILEDCSPYYIRFTHDRLNDIIEFCKTKIIDVSERETTFIHYKLPVEDARYVLSLIPIFNNTAISLEENRVSFFITKPGRYYRAHKDGLFDRFSINYTIQILDDKCLTSWYSDDDLKDYKIDNLKSNNSRECQDFIKENHIPLKTMVAKPNECILFNTELYHDWDNRNSKNLRVILTLRSAMAIRKNTYFEDIKKILYANAGLV
jgi:hypothetical protein